MALPTQDTVEENLKDIVQDLYEIQSSTHGYLGPETQNVLIQKIHDLTASLSSLALNSAPSSSTTASSTSTIIPPDIIAYVEDGRNPDIYTREFVELVQRRNAFLKGKIEAFRGFAEVLEEEMRAAGIDVGQRMVVREGKPDATAGGVGGAAGAKKGP